VSANSTSPTVPCKAQPGPVPQPGRSGPPAPTPLPYAALPHDLITDRRLTGTDVRLVGVILRFARAKAEAWPSVKTLAHELGKCERTVQYGLRRLEAAGWIVTRPADNPTGRILVLAWREIPCTPPVQRPYSQGMPRLAPEAKKLRGEEKGSAAPRRESKPQTPQERTTFWAETGWLAYPVGHPLRRLAERRVEEALVVGRPPGLRE
jgi:hypothetical protein